MFRCQACGVVSLPKVSPIFFTVESRQTTYSYLDAEGDPKTSTGSEIVRQLRVCSGCAGEDPKSLAEPDHKTLIGPAVGFQTHGRSCNGFRTVKDKEGKEIERIPCAVCQRASAYFNELPAGAITLVLDDKRVPELKASMAAFVLESGRQKALVNEVRKYNDLRVSQQMLLDVLTTLSVMQAYENRGGKL